MPSFKIADGSDITIRGVTYPWDEWLTDLKRLPTGQAGIFEQGTHFVCKPVSFVLAARNAADDRKVKIGAKLLGSKDQGSVKLMFIGNGNGVPNPNNK